MNAKTIIKPILILILLGSNIACDQISKNIVREKIDYNQQISLASKYITLTKVENTGAFLSLGNTMPKWLKLIFLTIFPLLALGFGLYYIFTKKNLSNLTLIAIGFIVGGGIGNIYDRLIYGSVTDFFHIDFIIFQTGIFNMADVSVMVGTFLLLGEYILRKTNLAYNSL